MLRVLVSLPISNCCVPPLKRIRDAINSPSASLRRQMAENERLMREKMVEKERQHEEERRELENNQRLLKEKYGLFLFNKLVPG